MKQEFKTVKKILDRQFLDITWLPGLTNGELEKEVAELENAMQGESKALIKAKSMALLLEKGRLGLTEQDIFQEKIDACNIIQHQRTRWWKAARNEYFEEIVVWGELLRNKMGFLRAARDFGHTTSDTDALVKLGFSGLLERLDRAEDAIENPTKQQKEFYEAGRIVLQALMTLCRRFADAQAEKDPENAACFRQLAMGAPRNLYEAMQLIIVYFYIHEYIGATRVRTLGRLDRIFYPFYEKDLEDGTLTHESAEELMKYFLNKFWAMDVVADMPFAIGGVDEQGNDVTNAVSHLIVDTYRQLNIYSPKIHVRVSEKTPADFVKKVLACIRGGSSSFVFANDTVAIEAMRRCGATLEEARNYVFIGCYEAAVFGQELPCTGTGFLSMPKLLELAFTKGRDHGTKILVGLNTGEPETYEAFVEALKKQLKWALEKAMKNISLMETHYPEINPDPLLSVMMEPCVKKGVDIYSGGAKYNNSSMAMGSIGSFADAVYAVKKLVYDEKRLTFKELADILKADWEGHEDLRLEMVASKEKYGNNVDAVDDIAVEFSNFFASCVNGHPNGRGGIFKAASYTTDFCFKTGKVTMATPDGRKAGQPFSKNLGAATGMDRNGITGVILSATKVDLAQFPNGSVLDVVLHPTAVRGEAGLDAMYALLITYFKKGGYALHGNVFDAAQLRKAQQEPEKYANLQVRVCGWNAYFLTLTKPEQEAFIKQAEMAQA